MGSPVVPRRLRVVTFDRRSCERCRRDGQPLGPPQLLASDISGLMYVQPVAARTRRHAHQVEPTQEDRDHIRIPVDDLHPAVPCPWLVLAALSPVQRHSDHEEFPVGDPVNASGGRGHPLDTAVLRTAMLGCSAGTSDAGQLRSPELAAPRRLRHVSQPLAECRRRHTRALPNLAIGETCRPKLTTLGSPSTQGVAAPSFRRTRYPLEPAGESLVTYRSDNLANLLVGGAVSTEQPRPADAPAFRRRVHTDRLPVATDSRVGPSNPGMRPWVREEVCP
jgi:hypothetical protein